MGASALAPIEVSACISHPYMGDRPHRSVRMIVYLYQWILFITSPLFMYRCHQKIVTELPPSLMVATDSSSELLDRHRWGATLAVHTILYIPAIFSFKLCLSEFHPSTNILVWAIFSKYTDITLYLFLSPPPPPCLPQWSILSNIECLSREHCARLNHSQGV